LHGKSNLKKSFDSTFIHSTSDLSRYNSFFRPPNFHLLHHQVEQQKNFNRLPPAASFVFVLRREFKSCPEAQQSKLLVRLDTSGAAQSPLQRC
jgi:hypothetical protein